ncbi:tetratricopeptide repeat protein [Singulisphaera sp. PoT]|uniref:tetratricopeptide repeat protein n=1 Tax=Singulisphaera sp. PoT TaxID=3411797 RepID=UPI003BF5EC32
MLPLRNSFASVVGLGLVGLAAHGTCVQATESKSHGKVVINDLSPVAPSERFVGRSPLHEVYRIKMHVPDATGHDWLLLEDWEGNERGYVPSEYLKTYDEAFDFYTQKIRTNPNQAEPYLRRGYLWFDRNEYSIALMDFEKALELQPGYPEAYQARGYLHYQQGSPRIADDDYAMALRFGGSNARLHAGIGDARLAIAKTSKVASDLDLAIQQFTIALQLDSNLTRAYLGRAKAYLERDHVDDVMKAKEDLDKAIRSNDKWAPAYAARGLYFLRLKDYAHAEVDALKAKELNPKNSLALRLLGAVQAKKDHAWALKSLDEAVKLDPKDAEAYLDRGRVHASQGKLDLAVKDFEKAAYYDRLNPAPLVELGSAHFLKAMSQQKPPKKDPGNNAKSDPKPDFSSVELHFAQALRLDPQFAPAFVGRGKLREAQDRPEEALNDLTTAVWLDPKLGEAYLARALLLANCSEEKFRNPKLALAMAQRGEELIGKDDPRVMQTLAEAYFSVDDYANAVNYQKEYIATSVGAKDPGAQDRLKVFEAKLPKS